MKKVVKYVVTEGNEQVLYNATFDPEVLNAIRKDIIENCGVRTHVSTDTDYPGFGYNFDLIRNYSRTSTDETREYDTEIRNVYHEEYDLIKEPKLASLINDFITYGFTNLLDFIYSENISPASKDGVENLQAERIELIEQAVSMLNRGKYNEPINFNSLKQKIADIETISKNVEINKKVGLKDEMTYVDLIKSEIEIKEVDREKIENIEKAKRFINI